MTILSARNVIAAILKRLTHRNANVQLYTLTLSESLSKNCGLPLHRELASKAFTAGLEKLITDRVRTRPLHWPNFRSPSNSMELIIFLQTTHDKVRNRALGLIEEWKYEFESNTELGIMEECYNNLKTKSSSLLISSSASRSRPWLTPVWQATNLTPPLSHLRWTLMTRLGEKRKRNFNGC